MIWFEILAHTLILEEPVKFLQIMIKETDRDDDLALRCERR